MVDILCQCFSKPCNYKMTKILLFNLYKEKTRIFKGICKIEKRGTIGTVVQQWVGRFRGRNILPTPLRDSTTAMGIKGGSFPERGHK
jgi:hypothetical protein